MSRVRRDLPSGTVTFLFTDVEGSTKLLRELGVDAYAETLAEHRRVLREVFIAHGGVEVDTQGDAFFFAFADANEAVAAATETQQALHAGPIRVRMGMHTGEPTLIDEGYVGLEIHRGARIAAAAHGGQVVLSRETRLLLDEGFPLSDLGEHRVKDFEGPVWIFQVGKGSFPPLKTISNTNLPKPASSFVGREREVGEVISLLLDGARLVTLTGPGGSGKTRLAIEAASELVPEHRNGVFWVGLAPLRDPALVFVTIGQILGARGELTAYIGDREMLLLLDNFEQVVEAAPDLSALLESCPNLHLLITSRELLRVRGEVQISVPPLADPEAVALFCTRAQLEADDTIAELCRRLDNLPLALELAAARTSVLSPAQILERLSKRLDLLKGGRDAEARQRTLRATIEWSHGLLTPEEQSLFARFAVFRGGCTLETAEAVAEADLDNLQSIVDKSLVRHREDRFWMLETIREYAAERLGASGETDELRRRHSDHFLALAEEAEPHLRGDPEEWLDRLEREHDNFRAAFDRFAASGLTELTLRLAGALQRFWYLRGHLVEGRRRLEAALAADERPTLARARALIGLSLMAVDSGDLFTMKRLSEEALALHLELGEAWGAAVSRFQLAHATTHGGDPQAGRNLFEDSVLRFSELGDEHYTLLATHGLAFTHYALGDLEQSRGLHESNLRLAREASNKRMEARSLAQLGVIAVDQDRIQDAFSSLERAYRIDREVGEAIETVLDLCRFAYALVGSGRGRDAVRVLSRAEARREELGATFLPWAVKMNERTLEAAHAQLEKAAFRDAWEEGRALTADEAVALALTPPD
jgi:predicted ATPase/class 3 adenylate cyclase